MVVHGEVWIVARGKWSYNDQRDGMKGATGAKAHHGAEEALGEAGVEQ